MWISRLLPVVCALAVGGCSTTITSAAVQEAQLAARVKTALVNDPEVGTRPIEVTVTGGVVRLLGRVDSAIMAERAVAVSREVPGVAQVISALQIAATPAGIPGAPTQDGRESHGPAEWIEPDDQNDSGPRLLAVGVSVRRSAPAAGTLSSATTLGPLVRLGSGRGWGPAIGFGWFSADWRGDPQDGTSHGRIRLKPVMGGVAYRIQKDRATISFSVVGGVSFNSIALPGSLPADEIPLDVPNSAAVRPGASLWIDLNRRMAVNIGGSYLVTRPRVRLLGTDGTVYKRAVRADAVLMNAGLVYKLF